MCLEISGECTQTARASSPAPAIRTPLPGEPGGKGHGGYAGFSIRVSREMTGWQIIGADGTEAMKLHGHPTPAAEINGLIGGREAGLALIDHSSNLGAPSKWFVVMNPKLPFGYLSPAVIFSKPHKMTNGEKLRLRYRAIVHPRRWTPDDLKREANRFSEVK